MADDFPNIFDYITQDQYIAYCTFRDTLSIPALRAIGQALVNVQGDKVAQAYSRYFRLDATLSSVVAPYKPSCFEAWERAADEARAKDPIRQERIAYLDSLYAEGKLPKIDFGFDKED